MLIGLRSRLYPNMVTLVDYLRHVDWGKLINVVGFNKAL